MNEKSLFAFTIANAALDFLSEDEEEEKEILSILSDELLTHVIEGNNIKKGRSQYYVDNIVPLYSDQDFKTHYRMTRETFQALYERIGPTFKKKMGRPTMCPKKIMLSAIWMLSTPDTMKSIGERFDLSKSSVVDIVKRFCMALIEHVSDAIKIPSLEEMKQIEEGFRLQTGFPGVIGVIDGTHIPIRAPQVATEIYLNQKKSHSIHLQVICDDKLVFWDCFCGYPGSVHDAEIFLNSEANEFLNSGQVPSEYHILGDGGYPLMQHLMVPYTDNGNLNNLQIKYNDRLHQTRKVVDNAIASLKNRFKRLKYIEIDRTDKVPMYVLATCILHNFCVKRKDYYFCTEDDENFLTPDILDETTDEAVVLKRDLLTQKLSE